MKKELLELQEQRKNKWDRTAVLDVIVEGVKDGDNPIEARKLTDVESGEYDRVLDDLEGIDVKIKQLERRIKNQDQRAAAEAGAANAAGSGSQATTNDAKEIIRTYSVIELLRQIDPRNKAGLSGMYKEMNTDAIKEASDHKYEMEGFGAPAWVFQKQRSIRDITTSPDTSGGNYIETELKEVIHFLENRTILQQMGADFMNGLIGDIDFPREDSSVTASWAAETATHAEENPTSDLVSLRPNRLGAFIDISKLMLIQTSGAIERRIRNRLFGAMARAIDLAGINGSGTGNEPEGILQTSGIGSVALGTNGAVPTWASVVSLVKEVAIDNADLGSLKYLINPEGEATLKTTEKATNTAQFIMPEVARRMNGYDVGVTNHIPNDLTKGSGTDLSAIIFGNWNSLLIGNWGGLDVSSNPFTKQKEGIIEVIANTYSDIAVEHPESFAAIVDMITI